MLRDSRARLSHQLANDTDRIYLPLNLGSFPKHTSGDYCAYLYSFTYGRLMSRDSATLGRGTMVNTMAVLSAC